MRLFAKRAVLVFLIQMMAIVVLISQNPYIQQFTTSNGLPSNTVYRIFQDSRKFIWMATDAGVARYDGTNFKYFTIKDGLNTNELIHIQEDSQGRIWMFNFNGTFNYYKNGRIFNGKNASFLDSLQSSFVFRKMYEDEARNIYFYDNSMRNVHVLTGDNNVKKYEIPGYFFGKDENNKPLVFKSLRFMQRIGKEFFYFTNGGLFKSKNITGTPIHLSESFYTGRVYFNNGNEILADVYQKEPRKLALYKFRDFKVIDTLFTPERTEEELINDAYQDSNDNYWISMPTRLYFIKGKNILFQMEGPIFQNILEDHEQNIWVSSLGDGVFKMSKLLNSHFHLNTGNFNSKGSVQSSKQKKGGIWVTNGNQLFLVRNKKIIKTDVVFDNGNIDQVEELANNTLVLGQPNFFLRRISGYEEKHGSIKNSIIKTGEHIIKSFVIDSKRETIASFYVNSIIIQRHYEPLPKVLLNKYDFERFYAIYYNANDQLFVNGKRIYKFNNGKLKHFRQLDKFSGQIIKQHVNLKNKMELFNVGGDSLFLFNGVKLFNLSAALDPSLDLQVNYICYNDPYLFLATNSHIYFFSLTDFPESDSKIELKNLDITYNNIHHLLIDKGELIVSSDDGLTFIPLKSLVQYIPQPPIPYFRNIIINDQPQPLFLTGSMLRGKNKLQFILGNIRFNSSRVQYAYRLEGLDKTWNTGSEQNISYQDLKPGKYAFKFKVKLPSSGWSEELLYHLEVRPTFYQHPLFFVFGSIIILILLYLFIYYQQKSFINIQNTRHQILMLEQKALHLTMNPHFIFNSLASIQSYILRNQPADAGNYLSQFARLIRQNLDATKTSMIDLDEEIDRLRNYLDLEQLRMNFRFSYNVSVDGNVEDEVLIPAMILQPVVENAIWHGLADIESGGKIQISFSQIGEQKLKIIIEDNGIGVKQAAQKKSYKKAHLKIGLDLTRKRLEILGKKMNVTTSFTTVEAFPGNPKPGTRVEIISPISFGKPDRKDQL